MFPNVFLFHGEIRHYTVGNCTDQHSNCFRCFSFIFTTRSTSRWKVLIVWLVGCLITSHFVLFVLRSSKKKNQNKSKNGAEYGSTTRNTRKRADQNSRLPAKFYSFWELNQDWYFQKTCGRLWKHFCVFNCSLALLWAFLQFQFGFHYLHYVVYRLSVSWDRKPRKRVLKKVTTS